MFLDLSLVFDRIDLTDLSEQLAGASAESVSDEGEPAMPRPFVDRQRLVLRLWQNLLCVLGNVNEIIVRIRWPGRAAAGGLPAGGSLGVGARLAVKSM